MRFTTSLACFAAAAQASTITVVFEIFSADNISMLSSKTFWTSFLQNLQRDVTNTESDCMEGLSDLTDLYDQLKEYITDDSQYIAGMVAKGQGTGTQVGYILDKGEKYIDLFTSFTNVYNQCDVDYYMIALSKATSNVAGAVNQIINTGFRTQDTQRYTDLAQAFTDSNETDAAQYLAEFVKDFLMAEIPDQATLSTYQNVGSLQN